MDAQQERDAILESFKETHRRLLSYYRTCIDNSFEAKSEQGIANSNQDQIDIIDEMIFKYAPSNGKVYVLCKRPDNYFENRRMLSEIKRTTERGVKIEFSFTQDSELVRSLDNIAFEKVNPFIFDKDKELYFMTNGKAIRITRSNSQESDVIPNAPSVAKELIDLLEDRKYSRNPILALPKTSYTR